MLMLVMVVNVMFSMQPRVVSTQQSQELMNRQNSYNISTVEQGIPPHTQYSVQMQRVNPLSHLFGISTKSMLPMHSKTKRRIKLHKWIREEGDQKPKPDLELFKLTNFGLGEEIQWLFQSLLENIVSSNGLSSDGSDYNAISLGFSPIKDEPSEQANSQESHPEPIKSKKIVFQETIQRLAYCVMTQAGQSGTSKLGSILNSPVGEGLCETLAHLAAKFNRADALQCLLDAGADPCVMDEEGRTPLLTGVGASALEVVKVIVRHPNAGRNLQILAHCQSELKSSPLIQAVKSADIEMVSLLISVMNAMGSAIAASNQLIQHSQMISNNGPSSSTSSMIRNVYEQRSHHNEQGMLSTEVGGILSTLEDSISQLLDVNGVDGFGRSALHWAAITDQPQIVKLLVQTGASVDSQTLSEETPLALAAKEGLTGMCNLLLMAGANPDLADHLDRTPRQLAEIHGNEQVIQLIDSYSLALNASANSSRSMYHTHSQSMLMSAKQGSYSTRNFDQIPANYLQCYSQDAPTQWRQAPSSSASTYPDSSSYEVSERVDSHDEKLDACRKRKVAKEDDCSVNFDYEDYTQPKLCNYGSETNKVRMNNHFSFFIIQ
ncbi:hypothetical protein Ciccas_001916 [Cichlidogyrus casuarinus]|uniref:Uncharacterized protein n=1 Tax=Cichlidogyrus casuarinus TaxID=1844966 RepID=A0ABD2QLV0_9PLAT